MGRRKHGDTYALKCAVVLLATLTCVFAGLKLCGLVGWSWLTVTAPLSVPFALFTALVLVCIVADLFRKEDEDDLFA